MTDAQLAQGYAKLATVLAPYVDVLCCETLSSAREGAAAARAAAATGMALHLTCDNHQPDVMHDKSCDFFMH